MPRSTTATKTTAARRSRALKAKSRKIRVAIIGVGNCASLLVQGVYYYRNAKPSDRIPGIMDVDVGGYHLRDVDFVAAFDVDRNKVGKDLAGAMYAAPNHTYRFVAVPRTGDKGSRRISQVGIVRCFPHITKSAPRPTE